MSEKTVQEVVNQGMVVIRGVMDFEPRDNGFTYLWLAILNHNDGKYHLAMPCYCWKQHLWQVDTRQCRVSHKDVDYQKWIESSVLIGDGLLRRTFQSRKGQYHIVRRRGGHVHRANLALLPMLACVSQKMAELSTEFDHLAKRFHVFVGESMKSSRQACGLEEA